MAPSELTAWSRPTPAFASAPAKAAAAIIAIPSSSAQPEPGDPRRGARRVEERIVEPGPPQMDFVPTHPRHTAIALPMYPAPSTVTFIRASSNVSMRVRKLAAPGALS